MGIVLDLIYVSHGFKNGEYDRPHGAKLLGEGGSATIYDESVHGEMRATKYPKKVRCTRPSLHASC